MARNKRPQGCIYELRCLIDGKKGYVGQSDKPNPQVRWTQHINAALAGSKWPIHRAINKHKYWNFSAEVIWRGPLNRLDEMEIKFIKTLGTFTPDGYNLTSGGRSGTKGYKHTAETLERISASVAASYVNNPALLLHRRTATLGATRSEETRAKISAAGKGRAPYNKGKKTGKPSWNTGGTSWAKGKEFSPEHCAKISATRMARNIRPSEATRRKIAETLKGNIPWNKGLKLANRKAV